MWLKKAAISPRVSELASFLSCYWFQIGCQWHSFRLCSHRSPFQGLQPGFLEGESGGKLMGSLAAFEVQAAVKRVARNATTRRRCESRAAAAAMQANANDRRVVALQAARSRAQGRRRQLRVAAAVLAEWLGRMSKRVAHLPAPNITPQHPVLAG